MGKSEDLRWSHVSHSTSTAKGEEMKVGDLVKVVSVSGQPFGIITKVVTKESKVFQTPQYWVKLCNKKMGAYPFLQRQLEIIDENR